MQAFGKFPQYLPLLGRLLVLRRIGGLLCERGAPDGVDAQVFIEHHEKIIEPALAEAFVMELCVAGIGGRQLFHGEFGRLVGVTWEGW